MTVANVRQLHSWHARTGNGNPGHPLPQAEPDFHGYTLLTAGQAEAVDDGWGRPEVAA